METAAAWSSSSTHRRRCKRTQRRNLRRRNRTSTMSTPREREREEPRSMTTIPVLLRPRILRRWPGSISVSSRRTHGESGGDATAQAMLPPPATSTSSLLLVRERAIFREGRRLARCCASTIGWQYQPRSAKRWTKPAQSKLTSKQNESDPNLHRILRRGRRRRQLDDEDHPPRNTAGSRIDPL